jgi:hypothetical protein
VPGIHVFDDFLAEQFLARIPKIGIKIELVTGMFALNLVQDALVIQLGRALRE